MRSIHSVRAGMRTKRHPVTSENEKYGPGEDPLEAEKRIGVITPRTDDEARQMKIMLDRMYNDADSQEEKRAIQLWRWNMELEATRDTVKRDFLRRFWCWLIGRGTKEDVERTPWGRANVAAYNDEVAAYVEMFIKKRMDYALKLMALSQRAPTTLNEFYLVFKYIVNGRMQRREDADGGSYFDFSQEDFLDDWEIMYHELDRGGLPEFYGEEQSLGAELRKGTKFDGHVPNELSACIGNLAREIAALKDRLDPTVGSKMEAESTESPVDVRAMANEDIGEAQQADMQEDVELEEQREPMKTGEDPFEKDEAELKAAKAVAEENAKKQEKKRKERETPQKMDEDQELAQKAKEDAARAIAAEKQRKAEEKAAQKARDEEQGPVGKPAKMDIDEEDLRTGEEKADGVVLSDAEKKKRGKEEEEEDTAVDEEQGPAKKAASAKTDDKGKEEEEGETVRYEPQTQRGAEPENKRAKPEVKAAEAMVKAAREQERAAKKQSEFFAKQMAMLEQLGVTMKQVEARMRENAEVWRTNVRGREAEGEVIGQPPQKQPRQPAGATEPEVKKVAVGEFEDADEVSPKAAQALRTVLLAAGLGGETEALVDREYKSGTLTQTTIDRVENEARATRDGLKQGFALGAAAVSDANAPGGNDNNAPEERLAEKRDEPTPDEPAPAPEPLPKKARKNPATKGTKRQKKG